MMLKLVFHDSLMWETEHVYFHTECQSDSESESETVDRDSVSPGGTRKSVRLLDVLDAVDRASETSSAHCEETPREVDVREHGSSSQHRFEVDKQCWWCWLVQEITSYCD